MRTPSSLPRSTRGEPLILESDQIEYLPTRDQHRIEQIDLRSVYLPEIELPEALFVETVESLHVQRRAIFQHDVEQQRRKQLLREQHRNELVRRGLARDQLAQHGQYLLEIGRVAAIGIDD